jgi:hypothetical protein
LSVCATRLADDASSEWRRSGPVEEDAVAGLESIEPISTFRRLVLCVAAGVASPTNELLPLRGCDERLEKIPGEYVNDVGAGLDAGDASETDVSRRRSGVESAGAGGGSGSGIEDAMVNSSDMRSSSLALISGSCSRGKLLLDPIIMTSVSTGRVTCILRLKL